MRRHGRGSPRTAAGGVALLAASAMLACNEHPVQKLDNVVTAVNRQENRLPAKTKIDFMFLIDNSGSMCEEQRNLTRNFRAFSDFLFEELGAAADYRIAVTSTDMRPETGDNGRFLANPAPPVPSLNCTDPDTGEQLAPDTQDCVALVENGELPQVIQSGLEGNIGTNCGNAPDPQACAKEDLERKFRCLATLGTGGDGFEKGLEAMRLSLSCSGPNAALFNQCCRDGKYDLASFILEGAFEPVFLRPDAILVVVIVTDEDDCSDPATNPAASRRAICKYGAVDQDGDGVPDGYRDRDICGDRSPQECFQAECGGLGAEECRQQRCVISRRQNSTCEWFRNELTPVDDYYRFLTGLKAQPLQQIVVATIAGKRAYTESGFEITYNEGRAADQDPRCDPMSPEYDPDVPLDVCCPEGRCVGQVQPSCQSANGIAFSGRRYLELAERFEDNGIGCPPEADEDSPAYDPDLFLECVNICVDDFAGPLATIRDKVARLVASYCLDKPPACQVPAQEVDGRIVSAHPCETDEERNNPDNYPIRVRMVCDRPESAGGLCPDELFVDNPGGLDQVLGADEWELVLGESGCPGGALVQLNEPPPAGAEVFVEFLVSITAPEASAADAAAAENAGDGG